MDLDKSKKLKDQIAPVPAIDPNAALEIEKITKSPQVPTVDKNASLKIDEAKESFEEPEIEKTGKKLFTFGKIIVALVIAITVLTGVFLFTFQSKKSIVAPKQESTPSLSAIKKEVLDRKKWSFEVLNGSGVKGVAKKAADKLEALGYKVISTGNADNSDYVGNQLFVTEQMLDKKDILLEDLKKELNVASFSGVLKNSTVSARLIIGKN